MLHPHPAEELALAQSRAQRQEESARDATAEASRLRAQLQERTSELQGSIERSAQLKFQLSRLQAQQVRQQGRAEKRSSAAVHWDEDDDGMQGQTVGGDGGGGVGNRQARVTGESSAEMDDYYAGVFETTMQVCLSAGSSPGLMESLRTHQTCRCTTLGSCSREKARQVPDERTMLLHE